MVKKYVVMIIGIKCITRLSINHTNIVIQIHRIQPYYIGNKFDNYFSWKNTYYVLLNLIFGVGANFEFGLILLMTYTR